MAKSDTLWIFFAILMGSICNVIYGATNEHRLLNNLLMDYQKYERPVANESLPVSLNFTLSLQQIIDLDERNQLLITNLWLEYTWEDVNLQWNKTEYGGIVDVRIPPNRLWTPDILMYNSASQEFDSTYPVNIVVTNNGGCKHVPPGIFKSTCKIDITWFPFDDQECELKFGSWTYQAGALNLTLTTDKGDISDFKKNGEWELLEFSAERHAKFYACCKDAFLDVTYKLKIRRRTMYYFSNLILPCVLIASMAVLGFYFPPESGEKVTLEITILMSLTFFMNVVSDMQPPSSETPLIGTYFSCIMIMVASSVVCTILVLNYHHRLASSDPMPRWVQTIFLQWIPWALRISRPGNKITRKSIHLQNKMRQLEKNDKNSKSLLANVLDLEDDFLLCSRSSFTVTGKPDGLNHPPSTSIPHLYQNSQHSNSDTNLSSAITQPSFRRKTSAHNSHVIVNDPSLNFNNGLNINCNAAQTTLNGGAIPNTMTEIPTTNRLIDQYSTNEEGIQTELRSILREIRVITNKIRAEAEASALENEWKFAAMVLDRVCLIIFTLFTVLLSAAVLLSAPHVIVW